MPAPPQFRKAAKRKLKGKEDVKKEGKEGSKKEEKSETKKEAAGEGDAPTNPFLAMLKGKK